MDEEEFLKCKILGFITPERLPEYLGFITQQCDDDVERISRVARETFLTFPTIPRMAELLYEIDDEYAIGYMCMFSVKNPGFFPRAFDEFLLFFLNRFPLEDIEIPMGKLVSVEPLAKHLFLSRIVSSWVLANRAFLHARIQSDRFGLYEKSCMWKERWRLILLSWGVIL